MSDSVNNPAVADAQGQVARGLDEDRLGQRRRLTRDLQSVRERLTSSSGLERSFDTELVRQFASRAAGPSSMFLAGLIAVASLIATIWITPTLVTLWSGLSIVGAAVLFVLARQSLKLPDQQLLARRAMLVALVWCQAVIWAGFIVLFAVAPEPSAKVFVVATLLFFGTIVVMMAHTAPIAVYGAMLALAVALAVFAVLERDVGTMAIAGVGLAGALFFVFLGNRLYSQAVESLEFRAEKDILIAELETANLNSDDARRRAEEANLAKSKFLATMSHELRTPLNAILGFSEVMKNEVFGPHASPSYKEYANDIHASGQHLLKIINEILDLSRIEAGRYELKEEATNLAYIADECCHMLQLRAKGKNQTLRRSFESDLPRVWADERAIRQVILNLLSNAVKFTPQGGDITVRVGWTASGGQYVSVTDNGPGIPESEIETVMSSFGRGSQAIKTAEEGTGLGLPIVKGFVEMHGGVFTLKSRLRVGTEVTFTIPAERVMDTLPALPPQRGTMRAA